MTLHPAVQYMSVARCTLCTLLPKRLTVIFVLRVTQLLTGISLAKALFLFVHSLEN